MQNENYSHPTLDGTPPEKSRSIKFPIHEPVIRLFVRAITNHLAAFRFLLLLFLLVCATISRAAQTATCRLPWIENQGQLPASDVRFYAKTFAGAAYVMTDGALVYASNQKSAIPQIVVIRETPVEACGGLTYPAEPTGVKVNIFHGADPAAWRTHLPGYTALERRSIYPGIDLRLQAAGATVEKIFTVHPGGCPEEIAFAVEGADALRVEPDGALAILTPLGEARFSAPKAWQEIGGQRVEVSVRYRLEGCSYAFEVGDYDPGQALMIDPLLAATYIGGTKADECTAITLDAQGRVVVAGATLSDDFPVTPGAYQTTHHGAGSEAFVATFSPKFTNLVAATFLGGSDGDGANALAVTSDGHIVVAGITYSSDFPTTPGVFQRTYGGSGDVFVAVFDASLSQLLASTYLGAEGAETETCRLALEAQSSIFVAGTTRSTNLPFAAGAYSRTLQGSSDAFIARLSTDLTTLLAGTYLGGSDVESAQGLAVRNGSVFVAGTTGSTNFPATPSAAFTTLRGQNDGFVAVLPAALGSLSTATYFGGTDSDYVSGLAADDSSVFVAGTTYSTNFPVSAGAYQTTARGGDGFVTRFPRALNAYDGTLLGGSDGDTLIGIALGPDGNPWVAGYTASADFPTSANAYQRTAIGSPDVVVARLQGSLGTLLASTRLGGVGQNIAEALAVDAARNEPYVAGAANSWTFPTTPGAFQPPSYESRNGEGFVARFDTTLSDLPAPPVFLNATPGTYVDKIRLSWLGNELDSGYMLWRNTSDNAASATPIAAIERGGSWEYDDYTAALATVNYYWVTASNAAGFSAFDDSAHGWRSTNIPLAADVDGDNKADPIVVQSGVWTVWLSGANYYKISTAPLTPAAAWPVAGDFDGDRKADPAAYQDGWTFWLSGSGYAPVGPVAFAYPGATPVCGDFDADGKMDPTLVVSNTWHMLMSAYNYEPGWMEVEYRQAYMAVAGDFDNDRYAEPAIYRDATWYLWDSTWSYPFWMGPYSLGALETVPVAGDFDGDGMADPAIFQTSTCTWTSWLSGSGYMQIGPVVLAP